MDNPETCCHFITGRAERCDAPIFLRPQTRSRARGARPASTIDRKVPPNTGKYWFICTSGLAVGSPKLALNRLTERNPFKNRICNRRLREKRERADAFAFVRPVQYFAVDTSRFVFAASRTESKPVKPFFQAGSPKPAWNRLRQNTTARQARRRQNSTAWQARRRGAMAPRAGVPSPTWSWPVKPLSRSGSPSFHLTTQNAKGKLRG